MLHHALPETCFANEFNIFSLVMERTRPGLPSPGGTLRLDLTQIGRPAGWLVVVAVRVGDVIGAPSETLAWLNPAI